MSSHLSIVAPDGKVLGTPDQVVARIAAAVPEVQWLEGPSSFEEVKVLASLQLPWTDEQRAVFSLPKRTGIYEREECSVRLYGFESYPLTSATVEVGGEGNPLPLLRRICLPNGWAVVGHAGRESLSIDLEADPAVAWKIFQQRESAGKALVGPPDKLRIPHDEDRFECVGHLADGKQFMAFVTGAFPDGVKLNWDTDEWRKVKRWMAVLHLFDAEGNHLSSETKLGGFDIEGRGFAGDKAWAELDRMLRRLGPGEPKLCDIWLKQFAVSIDGVTHSLLYQTNQPEDDGPIFEYVMLEPRDIMFHPPWDSGEYST
jgi:hypothetical protein